MNYIICPYRLVSSEIWYTNPDGLAPEEVFFDVIREDFLINNQTIVFGDKHLKHVYSHIHINKPADGIALLKIANRLVEEDEQQVWDKFPGEDRQFATLFIVSRKDATCFYIEENEKAFANMEDYINRFGLKKKQNRFLFAYFVQFREIVFDMFFENYRNVDIVDTGLYDCYAPDFVERVQKDADRIHAQMDFVPGSNHLLEKLVSGKWDDQFYIAEPGTPVTQCDFFEWQKNDQRSVQISR